MKTRTITKRIASFINWFINLSTPERLLYEVFIVFFMFPALLISIPLLGRLLIFVTGWDAYNVNVVFGRVFMVIEFPIILVCWLIGGITWGISCLVPGIDLTGENPVMFSVTVFLFYVYNIALIVGCLELIRWCACCVFHRCPCPPSVRSCPCPPIVRSPENEGSEAETGLKSQEDSDSVEAKSE